VCVCERERERERDRKWSIVWCPHHLLIKRRKRVRQSTVSIHACHACVQDKIIYKLNFLSTSLFWHNRILYMFTYISHICILVSSDATLPESDLIRSLLPYHRPLLTLPHTIYVYVYVTYLHISMIRCHATLAPMFEYIKIHRHLNISKYTGIWIYQNTQAFEYIKIHRHLNISNYTGIWIYQITQAFEYINMHRKETQ